MENSEILKDFPEEVTAKNPAHTLISEFRHRRLGWSRGSLVRLADGMLWRLPKIDLALLLTTSRLRNELSEALRIANDIRRETDGGKEQSIAMMLYHAQMANLGVQLLQVNYDLPDEDWKVLLSFDHLSNTFTMTTKISRTIGDSVCVWMPFFLTNACEDSQGLLIN